MPSYFVTMEQSVTHHSNNNFHMVHTARIPAPHDHSQHKQANTLHSIN